MNKNIYLLTVCLCLSILSGCSANTSLQSDDKVADSSKNNSDECGKIDPTNTSLLTSGIVGLATLNPIVTIVVGGVTYFTVDSGVFDCDKSEQ